MNEACFDKKLLAMGHWVSLKFNFLTVNSSVHWSHNAYSTELSQALNKIYEDILKVIKCIQVQDKMGEADISVLA